MSSTIHTLADNSHLHSTLLSSPTFASNCPTQDIRYLTMQHYRILILKRAFVVLEAGM
jgi:hypothetical protein